MLYNDYSYLYNELDKFTKTDIEEIIKVLDMLDDAEAIISFKKTIDK